MTQRHSFLSDFAEELAAVGLLLFAHSPAAKEASS